MELRRQGRSQMEFGNEGTQSSSLLKIRNVNPSLRMTDSLYHTIGKTKWSDALSQTPLKTKARTTNCPGFRI